MHSAMLDVSRAPATEHAWIARQVQISSRRDVNSHLLLGCRLADQGACNAHATFECIW
jgi:hypothetical protein